MEYFITGSHGFIGTVLCNYLEQKGDTFHRINLYATRLLRERYDFENATIINLAAYGNHIHQTDINEIAQVNVLDLTTFINFIKRYNFKKLYNISTSSVTLKTQTLYSASKFMGECLIDLQNDSRMINIRPYSVFGYGEADHRFIPTVIRCLKSGETMKLDCDATHDWIHVEDFIQAMLSGIYKEIGTGVKKNNLQIVRMLETISGIKLNYEPVQGMRGYDNQNWVCPVGVPHISLVERLKQVYEQSA